MSNLCIRAGRVTGLAQSNQQQASVAWDDLTLVDSQQIVKYTYIKSIYFFTVHFIVRTTLTFVTR